MPATLESEGLLQQGHHPHGDLERKLFQELQTAVLTPGVADYLVAKLMNAKQKQNAAAGHQRREHELREEIDRLTAAIAAMGHSEAILSSIRSREAELRGLAAARITHRQMSVEDIRRSILNVLQDIPALLAKSPRTAKAKLAQHVDSIRLIPQPDGTYIAEGEWDLLGNRGPVMVAGAGFEPATFGL